MRMVAISFISRRDRIFVPEFRMGDGKGSEIELSYCIAKGWHGKAAEYLCDLSVESLAQLRFDLKWVNGHSECFEITGAAPASDNADDIVENPGIIRFIFDDTAQVYVLVGNNKKLVIGNILTGKPAAEPMDGLFAAMRENSGDAYGLDAECIKATKHQFTYRYLPLLFENEDAAPHALEKALVREMLWDGTFDKKEDGALMRYHRAGMPRRIAVNWMHGNSEYSAYFWLGIAETADVIERFYGAHRDTKADFIVSVSPDKGKYSLSLFRQGLREPVHLPQSAYSYIVFQDRFECGRSENYDKPRGAWLW